MPVSDHFRVLDSLSPLGIEKAGGPTHTSRGSPTSTVHTFQVLAASSKQCTPDNDAPFVGVGENGRHLQASLDSVSPTRTSMSSCRHLISCIYTMPCTAMRRDAMRCTVLSCAAHHCGAEPDKRNGASRRQLWSSPSIRSSLHTEPSLILVAMVPSQHASLILTATSGEGGSKPGRRT
jgi:hypothetical protein